MASDGERPVIALTLPPHVAKLAELGVSRYATVEKDPRVVARRRPEGRPHVAVTDRELEGQSITLVTGDAEEGRAGEWSWCTAATFGCPALFRGSGPWHATHHADLVERVVVATATVTAVLPILQFDEASNWTEGQDRYHDFIVDTTSADGRFGGLRRITEEQDETGITSNVVDLRDQLPFADWSPGRWVIEFTDVHRRGGATRGDPARLSEPRLRVEASSTGGSPLVGCPAPGRCIGGEVPRLRPSLTV